MHQLSIGHIFSGVNTPHLQEAPHENFALTSAFAIAAIAIVATAADAQTRKAKRHYEDSYYGGNLNWQQPNQVHRRRDPSSYDGYRTGQPRTCGSDFLRYDNRGVPYGPY